MDTIGPGDPSAGAHQDQAIIVEGPMGMTRLVKVSDHELKEDHRMYMFLVCLGFLSTTNDEQA